MIFRGALKAVGTALTILVVVLFVNLIRHSSRQLTGPAGADVQVDRQQAAERLSRLLRLPTVSHANPAENDVSVFASFTQHLIQLYPNAHRSLVREDVGRSVLYRWQGSDVNLAPVLLMAHFDVVPGEEGGAWAHAPFSGDIAAGHIWGRGALDMKGPLTAIMEALDLLAKEGYQPRRSIFLALGHDEEVGGRSGNALIAKKLKAQGVRLHAVLDEGSVVISKILPNVDKPVALIGIAEKGYLTVELSVEADGGHASMPATMTNIEILARALIKVTAMRNHGVLTSAIRTQLHWLAPELPVLQRMVLSNLWLFEPLVKRQMAARPSGDAMLRTTIAPTMLRASDKENVLPHRASAVINFRVLQGTTSDQVMRGLARVVADDRVKIAQFGSVESDPSPVSDIEGEAFDTLHRSIHESFPDAIVVPSLVLGGTDSRHYRDIAENIYRFIPVRLGQEDLARFHGKDERISMEHLAEAISFYVRYLRRL